VVKTAYVMRIYVCVCVCVRVRVGGGGYTTGVFTALYSSDIV
jgi:hypothetical protein